MIPPLGWKSSSIDSATVPVPRLRYVEPIDATQHLDSDIVACAIA